MKKIAISAIVLIAFFVDRSHAQTPLPPLPELSFAQIREPDKYLGDRWSYMEAGKHGAPAVVLLHGIGANSMYWRFQYAPLAERFHVVAWNAPGYMLSDGLKADTPTCRDWADALADFLDAVALQRVRIVANSFGTLVAQCFAIYHSERIIKAVFTGTAVGWTDMPEAQKARAIADRAAQVAGGGYSFGARADALTAPGSSPELLALVRNVTRATHPRAVMQVIRFGVGNGHSPAEVGPKLTAPVLLIHGAEDRIAPLERVRSLHGALPNARLEILSGIGHLPEIEAAERVNALITSFFAE